MNMSRLQTVANIVKKTETVFDHYRNKKFRNTHNQRPLPFRSLCPLMLIVHLLKFTDLCDNNESTFCFCTYEGRKFVLFVQWINEHSCSTSCQEAQLFYESIPQNSMVQMCWYQDKRLLTSLVSSILSVCKNCPILLMTPMIIQFDSFHYWRKFIMFI